MPVRRRSSLLALLAVAALTLGPIGATVAYADDAPVDPAVTPTTTTADAATPSADPVPTTPAAPAVPTTPAVPTAPAAPTPASPDVPSPAAAPVTTAPAPEPAPSASAPVASAPRATVRAFGFGSSTCLSAPPILEVTAQARSIYVRWGAVSGASSYEVVVTGIGNGQPWQNVGGALSFMSTDLQPGTQYYIATRVRGSFGCSSGYNYSYGTTRALQIPAVPTLFSAAIVDPSGDRTDLRLVASWSPSSGASYYVWTADDTRTGEVLASGTTSDADVSAPIAFQRSSAVRFSVQAVNPDGGSEYASRSGIPYPISVPGPLDAGPTFSWDHRTVTATWAAPSDDGGSDVTGYAVKLLRDDGTIIESTTVVGTSTSFTVPGTTPMQEVVVSVAAINAAGVGAADEPHTFVPVTPPSAPTASVTTRSYGQPAIAVSWGTPADDGGAPLTGYLVRLFRADDPTRLVNWAELGVDAHSTEFRGLGNATDYLVDVIAKNAWENTQAAPVHAITTQASIPPAPPEPIGTSAGVVSVTVQGDDVLVHRDGGAQYDMVFGYAFSSPTALGWRYLDASGNARFSIAGLPLGDHHVVLLDDEGRTLGSAAFTVRAASAVLPTASASAPVVLSSDRSPARIRAAAEAGSLAETGTGDPTPVVAIALLMLVGGVALRILSRRRTTS